MIAAIVFSGREWILPVALGCALLIFAIFWSMRRSRLSAATRVVCGILKTIGIVTLALCLLDPVWVGERARPGANLFAIIADNSQGLQIRDSEAAITRGEALLSALTEDSSGWQSALEENFQVRRYRFDARLQNVRNFSELDFAGRASSLGGALKSAIEQWRGQPVAGVLLFTDGNATDITGELPSLEGLPPIYPVVLGSADDLRDLALNKIAVTQTAFEDAPVTIQAEVNSSGFGGAEIITRVREVAVQSNESLKTTLATNAGSTNPVVELRQKARGNDPLNFRFQVHPSRPGLHFYEVETRAAADFGEDNSRPREATLVNNRQMVVVDRGQEPFRVLYVSGRPNWEYKFLNRAIEEDQQVQLVSLIRVARREPKFEFQGRAGEASNPLFRGFGRTNEDTARYDQPVLIRLNTRDEFELRGGFPKTAEELFQYHAIIVDDLEAEFFTSDQMNLLQRFVSERGGGFLMLGGAESFQEGKYAPTPIGALLPVYVDRASGMRLPEEPRLNLTREGWLQPWTRLRPTEAEEKRRLEGTPPFGVVNRAREIKPGASVLATVAGPDGKAFPALVVQRFGLGRSAALLIGDMWHWGLKDEVAQKDLGKAWRQLVRWLVSDVPSRVTINIVPSPGGDPAEARIEVKVRDADYRPLDNAEVKLSVRPITTPGRATNNAVIETNSVTLSAEADLTRPGTYQATYLARNAGAYLVEANVAEQSGKVMQAASGWTSDPAAAEFRSLKPNRALLDAIAQKTGGAVISMADLGSFVRKLPERRAPITETWSYPLWHKPILFLFVLVCLVAEWGIRRWKGLP